ncbi:hypothetical protein [Phocaeicola vulgatus]|jgi:hypothetical protein|uniref:hypothetical protein n=2 Tax=Phocaeicola vulgatus TaxID=821 RepID=UPI003566CB91
MSDLNLENIVGFKAVDKDGNEQNVTVDEMVDMVSTRMVMALSETSTFAAAAATGNDVYENELPTVTDAANVRVLQSSGDAAKMTMQSLASKLGGLIGINDTWIRRRFAIKDCNTAIAGVYNVDDTTTNNFPTGAYKFGTLLVANSGFFGSQYFVPDNFNADPYIYIRPISNNGNVFREWAKIKVTIIT